GGFADDGEGQRGRAMGPNVRDEGRFRHVCITLLVWPRGPPRGLPLSVVVCTSFHSCHSLSCSIHPASTLAARPRRVPQRMRKGLRSPTTLRSPSRTV